MPHKTLNSLDLSDQRVLVSPSAYERSGFLQRMTSALTGFALRSFRSPNAQPTAFLHLDETQLLAHIDGELSKHARQQVADHLQSCWSCRGHFRDLCARVESYLINREHQLPDSLGDSGRRVAELRRRLTEVQQNLPNL